MSRRRLASGIEPVFLDLEGPAPSVADAVTLEAYARRWLTRHCRRLKRRARETYRYNLEIHILPGLGPATPLRSLTRQRIGDFLLERLASKYKARSVWLMFKTLRTMLNTARLDDGLLEQNPTERVGRLLPKRNDQPIVDGVLRAAELKAFLRVAPTVYPRLAPMFIVAVRAGLRLGELAGLQWAEVNLEKRRVIVRRSLDWRREAGTPKGGLTKDLPLSQQATAALRELFDNPARPRVAWVFCNRQGQPWSRTHIRRIIHRVCDRAGIPRRSIHALRHTFLTNLAEAGVNPWTIRDLARHRSIVTTEGYLHLNQRHLPVVDAVEEGRVSE